MGKSYTPEAVGSGVQTTTTLNDNFDNIETALEDTLSRSGLTPNAMAADFDMGGNDIINADNITATTEITVGGISMVAQATAAAASATAALASENAAATSETNAATSETNAAASATLASQWATLTGAQVAATDYSSKEYAIGTFTRGSASGGSSKDWATYTGGTTDDTEYSSKEYAIGTTVPEGSAKDWAIQAEDSLVDGSDYSAFHWAQKAMAIVGGVQGKVSSNDTTADYLGNKFTALHGLTWTERNDGADEDLEISVGSHLEIGGGNQNQLLNVYSSLAADSQMNFTNINTGDTSTDGFTIGIVANGNAYFWQRENLPIIIGTNATERMRILASGNVNIGGTHDTNRLMIHEASSSNSRIQFTNTTTGITGSDGLHIGLDTTEQALIWNYENTKMRFATNSFERLIIENDGGIYTLNATGGSQGVDTINAGALYVNGRIVTGSTPATSNTYKRVHTMYVVDKNSTAQGVITSNNLVSTWSKATWESLGPTGSGATNINTSLNVMNDMTDPAAVTFFVDGNGSANATAVHDLQLRYTMDATHSTWSTPYHFRAFNGSGSAQTVASTGGGTTISCNTDGVMELYWTSVGMTSEALEFIVTAIHEGEAN